MVNDLDTIASSAGNATPKEKRINSSRRSFISGFGAGLGALAFYAVAASFPSLASAQDAKDNKSGTEQRCTTTPDNYYEAKPLEGKVNDCHARGIVVMPGQTPWEAISNFSKTLPQYGPLWLEQARAYCEEQYGVTMLYAAKAEDKEVIRVCTQLDKCVPMSQQVPPGNEPKKDENGKKYEKGKPANNPAKFRKSDSYDQLKNKLLKGYAPHVTTREELDSILKNYEGDVDVMVGTYKAGNTSNDGKMWSERQFYMITAGEGYSDEGKLVARVTVGPDGKLIDVNWGMKGEWEAKNFLHDLAKVTPFASSDYSKELEIKSGKRYVIAEGVLKSIAGVTLITYAAGGFGTPFWETTESDDDHRRPAKKGDNGDPGDL